MHLGKDNKLKHNQNIRTKDKTERDGSRDERYQNTKNKLAYKIIHVSDQEINLSTMSEHGFYQGQTVLILTS